MRYLSSTQVASLLLVAVQAAANDRIGAIEFFGYKGLDISNIRVSMPIHEGQEYSGSSIAEVSKSVEAILSKAPTDVAVMCCDENGDRLVFIGLPGASYRNFAYNPNPTGTERLPADITDLYRRLDRAVEAAVRKGGEAAAEDDSNGYALIKDPAARSLQFAVRAWSIKNEQRLLRVLANSSAPEHRRVASDALGYARQSHTQIMALVRASRDPDGEVRNNATRALGVLASSNRKLAAEIPPDTFVEMLNSGTWSDRNKGTWVLMQITADRNPDLLAKIRSGGLDALIEMAGWRRASHSAFARILLGRVAGLPEDRLQKLAWEGSAEEITAAIQGTPTPH